MTYFWSRWLADALRADPFVAPRVVEVPGWRDRGRPAGEFSYLPSGVLCHHTACMIRSGHDPQSCINSIINGNSVAPGPISQLLGTWTPPGVRWNGSNPDPRIIVIAAGRSNHAGSGIYPWGAPSGNGSSIGIEWCGPPEIGSWPDVVVELYERVAAAILRHNGWTARQVTTHWEYATPRGRKIDQSGPHGAEPSLRPLQPWNPDLWRARIAARLTQTQPPLPPSTTEDDMPALPTPIRVYDSRKDKAVLRAGEVRRIPVSLDPATSQVTVNLTVVDAAGPGFLTVWGAGDTPPEPSNVNFTGPTPVANVALVPVDAQHIRVRATQPCHLVVDVQGMS